MRRRLIPIFLLCIAIITPFLVPKGYADVVFLSNTTVNTTTVVCQFGTCYAGECFTMGSTTYSLTSAQLSLSRTGSPTGSFVGAEIETVTGTTRSCLGTGVNGAIQTSATTFDQSQLTTSLAFYQFAFSVQLQQFATYEITAVFHCSGNCGGGAFFNFGNANIGQPAGQNGNDNVNGGGWTCITGACPSSNDSGFILNGNAVGISTSNQCIGNCSPVVNSGWTSQSLNYNFNISQTLFYLQQVSLQNAVVTNVTAVVAANYNATFGLTLIIGLYASNGACPNANPGSPNCPMGLVQSQQFVNPQKGTVTMVLNSLTVVTGTWLAPAWSATRSGLNLNDTTTTQQAYLMNGIMPAFISGYVITGNIKTNIKANLISTTSGGTTSPSQTVCNNDLVCFILVAIAALTPNDLFAGGILFVFIYTMATSAIILILISYVDRETGLKIQIPGVFFLLIFVIWTFFFWRIGALPVIVPVVEILILAVVFAGAFSGSLTSKGGSRE